MPTPLKRLLVTILPLTGLLLTAPVGLAYADKDHHHHHHWRRHHDRHHSRHWPRDAYERRYYRDRYGRSYTVPDRYAGERYSYNRSYRDWYRDHHHDD